MSRTSRSFTLASIMMLVCSLFAVVAAPTPALAVLGGPYEVTTTRDLSGSACGTSAAFPNACSLRQAMTAAIAAGGNVEITFNIPTVDEYGSMPGYNPGSGSDRTWTIVLQSALPIITSQGNGIIINGASQAGS